MVFEVRTVVDRRLELIEGVVVLGEPVAEMSRRLRVSRPTAYKWLGRYREQGEAGLADRSRKPTHSPRRTAGVVEELVCDLRRRHPAWGGRKLHHRLKAQGLELVPSPSAITDILARHDLLAPDRRLKRDWQRFEAEGPNQIWQMDFKGDFPLAAGRCYTLTVVDDYSRFNLCLNACSDQRGETVKSQLVPVFATYGLPDIILVDNGPPWGSAYHRQPHTRHSAWLMQLDIQVYHGRPYHPQTRGKDERFHRSLNLEVLRGRSWQDLAEVQGALDLWQQVYNKERPHEALGYHVPAQRYERSNREMPSRLPEIEYPTSYEVRKVQGLGEISFHGHQFRIGRAFSGHPVGLRPTDEDGVWDVHFCKQRVGVVDLRSPTSDLKDL
jgi:transposase InsO family protein